jgi:hypothetical protein
MTSFVARVPPRTKNRMRHDALVAWTLPPTVQVGSLISSPSCAKSLGYHSDHRWGSPRLIRQERHQDDRYHWFQNGTVRGLGRSWINSDARISSSCWSNWWSYIWDNGHHEDPRLFITPFCSASSREFRVQILFLPLQLYSTPTHRPQLPSCFVWRQITRSLNFSWRRSCFWHNSYVYLWRLLWVHSEATTSKGFIQW